jgi:regulator of protease activity HflC (stomatin/prohibitin superfamily)
MNEILSFVFTFGWILGTVVVSLFIVFKSFANAGPKQYITLEKRWVGKPMKDGRTVALTGEIGLQAKILGPGLHWFWPFINIPMKHNVIVVQSNEMMSLEAVTGIDLPIGEFFGKPVDCKNYQDGEAFLTNGGQKGYQSIMLPPGEYMINPHLFRWKITGEYSVEEGEVGMIEATAGAPIPAGRIFADPVECDSFQDSEKFFKNGGQKGPQLGVLTPGKYRFNPFLFKFHSGGITIVPGGYVGTVEAVDGQTVPSGRLLAKETEGHENFEKGDLFIKNGGQKGRQLQILMPGSYRINTMMFKVNTNTPWEKIGSEDIGIVTVLEGEPITDPTKIAAEEIDLALHGNFQNAAAYLSNKGQKGLQIPVLRSGNYAINPWFASVKIKPMTTVDIGKCAVVTSFVGKDGEDTSDSKVNAKIVPNGCKGIWKDPLGPGKHPINTETYRVDMVPTNQITLSWADARSNAHELDSNLKTITLRTADAFSVNMDVNVIIHIPMENAPKVIANQGSVASLISQVLEPAISSHFRNAAQYIKALDLYTKRKELQETAKEHIINVLKEHFIDSKDTLIADVVLPEALTKIVSDKQIAEQEKATRIVQTQAEDERRKLSNMTAQANMQGEVVASERGVEIADNVAKAAVKKSEGEKQSAINMASGKSEAVKLEAAANAEKTTLNAEADAKAKKVIGEAEGKAIESVGLANAKVVLETGKSNAESYKLQVEAMGQDNFGRINSLKEIKDLKLKLVPDVLIMGAGEGSGGIDNFLKISLLEKVTGKDFLSLASSDVKKETEAVDEKK